LIRSQKKYTAAHSRSRKGIVDKTRPPAELDRLKYIQARDPDEPDEFEHGMSGVREVEAVVLPSIYFGSYGTMKVLTFIHSMKTWICGFRKEEENKEKTMVV
jgi:hypothetical protein